MSTKIIDQKTRDLRLTKAIELMSKSEHNIGKELVKSMLDSHYHFDMRTWGENQFTPQEYDEIEGAWIDEDPVCGTTACLAGTLGLHPWFRRQGFKGKWYGRDDEGDAVLEPASGLSWEQEGMKFFGISWDEMALLFLDTDNTKKRVVDALRHLRRKYRYGEGDVQLDPGCMYVRDDEGDENEAA